MYSGRVVAEFVCGITQKRYVPGIKSEALFQTPNRLQFDSLVRSGCVEPVEVVDPILDDPIALVEPPELDPIEPQIVRLSRGVYDVIGYDGVPINGTGKLNKKNALEMLKDYLIGDYTPPSDGS